MSNISTLNDVQTVLRKIKFKNWQIEVTAVIDDAGYLLQWTFLGKDTTKPLDNQLYMQYCREWFISHDATETQLIRTAWLAVQQAMMHEAAELFLYNGIRLFDPHTDYVKLAEYMNTAPQDKID
jgi:hypothetical protein